MRDACIFENFNHNLGVKSISDKLNLYRVNAQYLAKNKENFSFACSNDATYSKKTYK